MVYPQWTNRLTAQGRPKLNKTMEVRPSWECGRWGGKERRRTHCQGRAGLRSLSWLGQRLGGILPGEWVVELQSTHLLGIDLKPNTITRPAKILVDGVCVAVFGWFRPLMVIVLLCDCYVMHVSCFLSVVYSCMCSEAYVPCRYGLNDFIQ